MGQSVVYCIACRGGLIFDIFMQDISIPMLSSKFLHLKYLNIKIEGVFLVPYDLFSLVSFLDAAPCLETFDLYVSNCSSFQDTF
jgi:hypothetical protein